MSLKDIPLQLKIDSEEDLRAMVLAYFSELGFGSNEITCEDYFTIYMGHHSPSIDKQIIAGRSDILVSRNGKPLAIIETKAPSNDLTDEDARQAISYARALATMAPFAIVTNGIDTKVYDVAADILTRVDDPQDSVI
jgi:type I site-specific restriction endonuclease